MAFFCGAFKKNAAGPTRGRVAHGRQRNAGKREAHFCPKGMVERKGGGNTWKTYRRREAARPCAEQEQKAARKGNSKEEKPRLLPCEGQNQPTPSRRKIAGTPQFSGHKMPPTWGEAAASPRREPRQGGKGSRMAAEVVEEEGKVGGGEEAYVPTFQCSKSFIAISDFFVNCFFENSFHRPFLLSSSFKNASNAAFFPNSAMPKRLLCRQSSSSSTGKIRLEKMWISCHFGVLTEGEFTFLSGAGPAAAPSSVLPKLCFLSCSLKHKSNFLSRFCRTLLRRRQSSPDRGAESLRRTRTARNPSLFLATGTRKHEKGRPASRAAACGGALPSCGGEPGEAMQSAEVSQPLPSRQGASFSNFRKRQQVQSLPSYREKKTCAPPEEDASKQERQPPFFFKNYGTLRPGSVHVAARRRGKKGAAQDAIRGAAASRSNRRHEKSARLRKRPASIRKRTQGPSTKEAASRIGRLRPALAFRLRTRSTTSRSNPAGQQPCDDCAAHRVQVRTARHDVFPVRRRAPDAHPPLRPQTPERRSQLWRR